jgi:hypothetical protein
MLSRQVGRGPIMAGQRPRVMFTVEDIDDTLARLRKRGAVLVGEVAQYSDTYRLCYICRIGRQTRAAAACPSHRGRVSHTAAGSYLGGEMSDGSGVTCSITPLRLTTITVPVALASSCTRRASLCIAGSESRRSRSLACLMGFLFMSARSSHARHRGIFGVVTLILKFIFALVCISGKSCSLPESSFTPSVHCKSCIWPDLMPCASIGTVGHSRLHSAYIRRRPSQQTKKGYKPKRVTL